MPWRPASPCSTRGCPNKKPCPIHSAHGWNHGGKSRQARGYDAKHDELRRRVILEEPLCRRCGVKATKISDHIVPLSRGGQTVRSNLQGLCQECSDAKTIAERRA